MIKTWTDLVSLVKRLILTLRKQTTSQVSPLRDSDRVAILNEEFTYQPLSSYFTSTLNEMLHPYLSPDKRASTVMGKKNRGV